MCTHKVLVLVLLVLVTGRRVILYVCDTCIPRTQVKGKRIIFLLYRYVHTLILYILFGGVFIIMYVVCRFVLLTSTPPLLFRLDRPLEHRTIVAPNTVQSSAVTVESNIHDMARMPISNFGTCPCIRTWVIKYFHITKIIRRSNVFIISTSIHRIDVTAIHPTWPNALHPPPQRCRVRVPIQITHLFLQQQ